MISGQVDPLTSIHLKKLTKKGSLRTVRVKDECPFTSKSDPNFATENFQIPISKM